MVFCRDFAQPRVSLRKGGEELLGIGLLLRPGFGDVVEFVVGSGMKAMEVFGSICMPRLSGISALPRYMTLALILPMGHVM